MRVLRRSIGTNKWQTISAFLGCLLLFSIPSSAQSTGDFADAAALYSEPPQSLSILGISVEGAESEYTQAFVRQASGLRVGQEILVPGDPAVGDAIRSIYRLGMFSDVKILDERRIDNGIYIAIVVREEPKLKEYSFEGIKKSHRKDLRDELPLIPRSPVRDEAIENSKRIIKEFYEKKGHPLAEVSLDRTENPDNTISLKFGIDKGPKVKVEEIEIDGNESLSDRTIRKRMDTKQNSKWRFWRKAKFDQQKYEKDQHEIVSLYNERGHYDAKILSDSVSLDTLGGKPGVVVDIDVYEGDVYHIKSVNWEGNTLYPDFTLTSSLGLSPGDVYNSKRLEQNLFGNKHSTDVASLYLNRGYMRFRVEPSIKVVGEDSLELNMDIGEGDVYRFGNVTINGNTKTKDHVVRRELTTFPGQTFSRDAIQESVRRLVQLNYFSQESLGPGPEIEIDDAEKTVDLTYNLEETGSDQLELSGTWGQFGLVLQLRFTFNNFSAQDIFKAGAWRPLPAGDGQKLSLGVQTNGRFYQQYSLSFSEPWFKGKPRLAGLALSYSRIGRNPLSSLSRNGGLVTGSARVFYEQRLKWPDDLFSAATSVGYQYFDNDNWLTTLPQGVSNEITLRQSISRNSTNHPIFPSSGSRMLFSVEVAPPLGKLIQYHKWRFQTGWNLPLSGKLSLGISTDYGFIGSINGNDVDFERFVVGGSPFETSGFNTFFGKDIIYMRGYPISSIGPRLNDEPVGGRILNKYSAELRWVAVQSSQLQAAPYLFAEAANTWNGLRSYDPSGLYRSAGMGIRMFLPILGMVEIAYGYNFDEFESVTSSHDGSRKWTLQFTLGQGFNQ